MGRSESQVGLLERPVPQVLIHPEVLDPIVPYTVSVDEEAVGAFLEAHGMRAKKVPSRILEIRRFVPKYSNIDGRQAGKKMILACDNIWQRNVGRLNGSKLASEDATRIVQHEGKHAIDATKITTQTVDWSMKVAMAGQAAIVFPTLTLLTDYPLALNALISGYANLLGIIGVVRLFDRFPSVQTPWESRADKFEDRIKDDPKWHNLVTLTAKQ